VSILSGLKSLDPLFMFRSKKNKYRTFFFKRKYAQANLMLGDIPKVIITTLLVYVRGYLYPLT